MASIFEYCLLAFGAGVLSHVGYFNRGEHHMYGARYVQIFFVAIATAVVGLYQGGETLSHAIRYVCQLASEYLAGVYSSLVLYRLLLHPLNGFPGPLGARVSSFWLSIQVRDGKAYRKVQELHNQYGDFVRVGSSDLSITHPKAVDAIYGIGSKCTKTAVYDITLPMVSLHSIRVKAQHDRRRRTWSPAFSDKALRGYEERIKTYQNKLLSQLEAFDGQPVDISKWLTLYSFDVMGDLAFGKSFDMLDASEEHWAIKLLNEGLKPLGWMLPPWFFRAVTAIPGATRNWWRFIGYCAQRMEERRKVKPAIPDISSVLLEPLEGREPTREEREMMKGESQLIIVAGSDTTAAALSYVMFELSRHPEHIQKLREELHPYVVDSTGEFSHQKIADLHHLNGIIWETLRLHPPVPTSFQRKTPPEGIEIGGKHMPGDMTVFCPQYVIGRKEEVYPHAEEFLPERWYLYPDMVTEKSAWAPFSVGPFGCIGKPLALLSLRTTIAQIVMRFDIGFPDDETDRGTRFETNCRDHFTMSLAELKICLKRRKK